ncbi:MAG: HoxN/HupN/NixA family nickel/cobalt transporter [Candidatus Binataceae bacterium]
MDPGSSAPLGIALLGLLLGMRHATDPDHVIAVTAILSRERRLAAATLIGVVWGLGHTVTVLAVGAAIIIFKLAIPVRLGLAMEFAVAIVLILLGLGTVGGLLRRLGWRLFGTPPPDAEDLSEDLPEDVIVHSHYHSHDGALHRHPHVHQNAHEQVGVPDHREHALAPDPLPPFASSRRLLRSFGVGLVHGLAGSAAIALLVLSAIPAPLWATLYLVIFCVGTIVGMGLITTAIATPLIFASTRMSALHQRLVTGSGLLSFCFGLFLAYQVGIVDRLFAAAPVWIPH